MSGERESCNERPTRWPLRSGQPRGASGQRGHPAWRREDRSPFPLGLNAGETAYVVEKVKLVAVSLVNTLDSLGNVLFFRHLF